MNDSPPVVDVKSNTVNYAGKSFFIRPLSEGSFTALIDGVPVGRLVYVFGSAEAVAESETVTEDELTAVSEAWFAAIEA
jgi:hypothetical protein